MGWSTELFCNLSFNRETFNSRYDVESRIDEVKQYLQYARERVRDFSLMTEPAKFCPENYDPIIWVRNEVTDALNNIEEYSIELYKLNVLLDNWDRCHDSDGLGIDPPDGIGWNTAFITGDFVKTIKYPNSNDISQFE